MLEMILGSLLLLSVLVFVHELGHYLMAKKFGIKVEEFGFGFPPKIWGKKVGETVYSINLLPIGGFVKLYGEDDAGGGSVSKKTVQGNADLDRAFFARPAWQRAVVVLAGVVMNFLLAVVIYYVFLSMSGFKNDLPKITDHTFWLSNTTVKQDVVVGEVSPNSPAEDAKIRIPSAVVDVNDTRVKTVDDFVALIEQNKGQEVEITFRNLTSQEEYDVNITPRANPPENEGALGVSLFEFESYAIAYENGFQKLISGIIHPINLMAYNLDVIGFLIAQSIAQGTAEPVGQSVSGPVGIVSVVGEVISIPEIRAKILQTLNLAGLLSISLAFFNVLPIPALDGGRLFFILIEMFTGKKVPAKFEAAIHAAGLFVLLSLVILVSISDVIKLFSR